MYHALHIFFCAILCLAVLDHGDTAENPISAKNNSTHLISTVGNILTPLLLKQIERRLLNHTAGNDAHLSTDNLASSTPSNIRITTPSTKSMGNHKPSNPTIKKPRANTAPTTILFPADGIQPGIASRANQDGLELDSARAQQRQLENQFPFDFRNNFRDNFGTGFQGIGRQLNGGYFGGTEPYSSDQFRPPSSLDGQRSSEDVQGVQGIGSQFPGRESIFNGPNRPFNSQGSLVDFDRFQDFGRFGYDGRLSDANHFFDPNFRAGTGAGPGAGAGVGVGVGTGTGAGAGVGGLADRFNNFAGQQDPRNNLPSNYRQDLRNNFQNPAINPQINNQGSQGLPFRSFADPSAINYGQNYAQNSFDPSTQRFQNPYPDDRNPQRGLNYPPLPPPPQLFFPNRPDDAVSPGPVSPIGSQNSSNNKENNGVTSSSSSSSSLASSRRSEDSATRPTANVEKVATSIPGVESLQDRIELERLFFPSLDDYSDVRVSSDIFKQHLLASNIIDKNAKNNVV